MAFSPQVDAFRALHEAGCFVMPNPWDIGSARWLRGQGFKALATTSAGFAFTQARADQDVPLDMMLAHIAEMVRAVPDLPVNADFENGYADDARRRRRQCEALRRDGRRGALDRGCDGTRATSRSIISNLRSSASRAAREGDRRDGLRRRADGAGRMLSDRPPRCAERIGRAASRPMPRPAPTCSMRPDRRRASRSRPSSRPPAASRSTRSSMAISA